MHLISLPAYAQTKPVDFPLAVPGFIKPASGEHPRLLFRRADIPRLRDRMSTPQGRQILARLRHTLGNEGETLPVVFNTNPVHNQLQIGRVDPPVGAFTNGHAAGFGFLFVLTADRKYALMARQCLELMFEGASDRDERYTWTRPGAGLRTGMMLVQVAMAYDFCYDAWPADFRERVAREMIDYRRVCWSEGPWEGGRDGLTFDRIVEPYYPPGSNHFGALVGGAAMALLAVDGDPEVASLQSRIDRQFLTLNDSLRRALTQGLGDGGFFAEGPGPFQMNTNTSLTVALNALKVARGQDYISAPNGHMPTLKYVYELIPTPDGPQILCRSPSSYGDDSLELDGSSHGGLFSQGFGAIPEQYKPALLWTWTNVVEPTVDQRYARWVAPGESSFDAISYPHRAVLSYINWPVDVAPVQPARLLPTSYQDSIHRYFAFRNRWQDADDSIVTFHLGGPRGFIKCPPGAILVRSLGVRAQFPVKLGPGTVLHHHTDLAGNGHLVAEFQQHPCAVLVDFTRRSGAEVLIAMTHPSLKPIDTIETVSGKEVRTQSLRLSDRPWVVQTISVAPVAAARGEDRTLVLNAQRLAFDGTRIEMIEVPENER
jgi:hypothetical protein